MAASSSTPPTIKITSSDGDEFTLSRDAAEQSEVVKDLLASCGTDDGAAPLPIPLPNVSTAALRKVVQWLEKYKGEPVLSVDEYREQRTPSWHKEFFKVETDFILEIMMAANFMNIQSLLNGGAKAVAALANDKSVEKLREIFGLENDFTPEEEEQIRRENAWCE